MTSDFVSYAKTNEFIVNLGLSRVKELLSLLGEPQEKLNVIHVAGTNGKGSFCAFLSSILTCAHFKTGLFSTPELVSLNERISIDGNIIPDSELSPLLSRIEDAAGKMEDKPTPFEIWAAAAYLYFYEKRCNFAVIEVCMGGDTDATNVISKSALSVITRLSIDHTAFLGKTLPEITAHKCGIIKPSCPVLTLAQDSEAMRVIEKVCRENDAPLFVKEAYPSEPCGTREILLTDKGRITSALSGFAQAENASLAIEAARLLNIDSRFIKRGIESARHKGRFELLSDSPFIIFDGAHNEGGVKTLTESLKRYFPAEKFTFVFAAMRDKEIGKMLSLLKPLANSFVFTSVSGNTRSETAENLLSLAKELELDALIAENLTEAIELAKLKNKKIIVCGSLYLYKNLPQYLQADFL